MTIETINLPVSITRNRPYVSNKEFRKHVAKILKTSTQFDSSNINRWTSERFAEDWESSRTHPTYSVEHSYESTEFFGDKLANSVAALYVTKTYPEVVNTEWLTKIQNYMHSRKGFMQVSYYMDLYKYVLVSQEGWNIVTSIPQKFRLVKGASVWNNPNWKKMLTDLFESFIGTLFKVVQKDQLMPGVAYEVIYQVGIYYFPKIELKLDIYFLVDSVTWLKESMDEKRFSCGLAVNDPNPRFRFVQHMTREERMMSVEGIEEREYRWILTFPDPREKCDNKSNAFQSNNTFMTPVTVVVGNWQPDINEAKTEVAKKGIEEWIKLGYKVKKKPNMDERSSWKESK